MPPDGASLFRFDQRLKKPLGNARVLYPFLIKKGIRATDASEKFNLVGIDEAGRGPLAGPVVACAAFLPQDFYDPRINDSKRLDPKLRLVLYKKLTQSALWAVGCAQVDIIDSMNILRATHCAMRAALENLLKRYPKFKPDLVLVDGLPVPEM